MTPSAAEGASIWTTLKTIAELLAYAAALIFFIYKAASGYYKVNLSLKLTCRRQPSPGQGTDYLSVTATIKKGEVGAIVLYDVDARATYLGKTRPVPPDPQQLPGVERLSYKGTRILWDKLAANRWLNLPPGDEVQFSTLFEVDAQQPCLVEVVVFGRKRFWPAKTGQWRSSEVVLPYAKP
jgi:hypothetical protein